MKKDNRQSWEIWLGNAIGYEKAFDGRKDRSRSFSTTIKYNLIALALESYVMAMVNYHGGLPDNHTFTDLIQAWEQVAPIDEEIKQTILEYEDVQSLCSVNDYKRSEPTAAEVEQLGIAVKKLGSIVRETVNQEALAG